MKEIFRFSFDLKRHKHETVVEKLEDGTEVTTKKKVEFMQPFQAVLKEPSRRQSETLDNVFSKEVNAKMKDGYLTRAMALKLYQDNGGIFSDSVISEIEKEARKLPDLYLQIENNNLKIAELEDGLEKNTLLDANKELENKVVKINKQFTDLQSIQNSIFAHAAETKALEKVIEWMVLNLTHIIEGDGDGTIKPMYPGDSTDEKFEKMCQLEDAEDDIHLEVSKKSTSIYAFWYFKKDCTKEELKELCRKIDSKEY